LVAVIIRRRDSRALEPPGEKEKYERTHINRLVASQCKIMSTEDEMFEKTDVKKREMSANVAKELAADLTQGVLATPKVPAASAVLRDFVGLCTPGINASASLRGLTSDRVHIDISRPEGAQVGSNEFLSSLISLRDFMSTYHVDSIGINTRVGAEQSFIADDLQHIVTALRTLPSVSMEITCHVDWSRSLPFASGLDRLLLGQALTNTENLVSLSLTGYWETGSILEAVGTCTNLSTLTLRDIQLIDVELEHLADLSRLKELEIACGQLSGWGFSYLKHLPLESVALSDQWISEAGIKEISGLNGLRTFGIRRNYSGVDFEQIKIEKLLSLGNLPALETLYCTDVHEDPEQLRKLLSCRASGLFPALIELAGERGEPIKL
jgi:Leucine-rich repeat (LRR) protein